MKQGDVYKGLYDNREYVIVIPVVIDLSDTDGDKVVFTELKSGDKKIFVCSLELFNETYSFVRNLYGE